MNGTGVTVGAELAQASRVPERFSFVEVGLGEGQLPLESFEPDQFAATLDERDLGLSVHLPFTQPLATGVPEYDAAVLTYLRRVLDACATAGAVKAIAHASARDPTDEAQRRRLAEQMRSLAAAGADRGVEVCFENVGQARAGLPLDALGDAALAEDLAVCFDIGHAQMEAGAGGVERFLSEYGDRVSHLHVHDVRERGDSHIPVGSGQVDFDALGSLSGFDGTTAVEVFTFDGDILADSADRVERVLAADS